MDKQDFLFELGTEELPARALSHLVTALQDALLTGLQQAGLTYADVRCFATPRRLAVLILALDSEQPKRWVERKGPAFTAAFDASGHPTKACEGFARACGIAVSALQTLETPQGRWMVYRFEEGGKATMDLLPRIVQEAISALPIAKPMRWGDHAFSFLRPVQWVVIRYGDQTVPAILFGLTAGDTTEGHRFHHPDPLLIKQPRDYEKILREQAYVLADITERRTRIRAQAAQLAAQHEAIAVIDEALLDEITGLVEWPVALLGHFDPAFLTVPKEALISAMQIHQKCFPLADQNGKLLPYFITISHIESRSPATVVAGNERVMRARLSDAAFFYAQDREQRLMDRLPQLRHVIFQKKLGSLYDKSQRLATLTAHIAPILQADPLLAHRAGLLAKTDLLSTMVGEFPELQGVMGSYYALADGEPTEVALALKEQYLPRFSGDHLPESAIGSALALADRLDHLVGIFAIQQAPTGDKDPFALRRAAIAVLRLLIEKKMTVSMVSLLEMTAAQYKELTITAETLSALHQFLLDRMRAFYAEREISAGVLSAVLNNMPQALYDASLRITALQTFWQLPEAKQLTAVYKRANQLLSQAQEMLLVEQPDLTLCEHPAERALALALETQSTYLKTCIEKSAYTDALFSLAKLQAPLDQFFEAVMVMVDDPTIRRNRLLLLSQLRNLFISIGDISMLQESS